MNPKSITGEFNWLHIIPKRWRRWTI